MDVGLSGFLKHRGFLIRLLRLEDPKKLSAKLFDNSAVKSPIKILLPYLPNKLFSLCGSNIYFETVREGYMNMKWATCSCRG